MDVEGLRVQLPEPKAVKASYLLAVPQLQHGVREVPLKLAQELRGCAQFWSTAQPALKIELPVLDRMLSGEAHRTGLAQPTGTEAQREAAASTLPSLLVVALGSMYLRFLRF